MTNDDQARTNGGWISRRSLNRMILGASAGGVALTEGAAAPRSSGNTASSTVLSGGTVEDHLAIETLIYRLAMSLDSLDTAAFMDCYAPEAPHRKHAQTVIDYHRQYEHTMHQVVNHVHTVRGSTAKGITYCVASMVKRAENGLTKFDVYFLYRDELVKHEGRWLFFNREIELAFSTEAGPVQPGAPLLGMAKAGSFRTPPILDALKP